MNKSRVVTTSIVEPLLWWQPWADMLRSRAGQEENLTTLHQGRFSLLSGIEMYIKVYLLVTINQPNSLTRSSFNIHCDQVHNVNDTIQTMALFADKKGHIMIYIILDMKFK